LQATKLFSFPINRKILPHIKEHYLHTYFKTDVSIALADPELFGCAVAAAKVVGDVTVVNGSSKNCRLEMPLQLLLPLLQMAQSSHDISSHDISGECRH